MRYYAGIDGGQTATSAVIADERGRIAGRGKAGPADEVDQGPDSTRLRDALDAALRAALRDAGLSAGIRFASIVAGVSGYEGRVYGAHPQLPADVLILEHDAPVAHAGALGGEPGAIVVAGTGSVAYAVNAAGHRMMAGGWGYLFGDEGSAFWIARSALADAMRDEDRQNENDLIQTALRHFDVDSLRELARSFYTGTIDRAQLAAFAPVVLAHPSPQRNDGVHYLNQAAAAIVRLARTALEWAQLRHATLALCGGLFANRGLHDAVRDRVQAEIPGARIVPARYDAAIGALLLAYRAAGVPVPEIRG